MSATITRVDQVSVGVFRVTFSGKPERSDLTQAGRNAAAGEAHTLVGAAQNVRQAGKVWTADYSPIRRTAPAAAPAQAPEASGDDNRLAYLERELARVTDLLAAVTGTTANARPMPPTPVPVSPGAAKIAAKIAASHALACKVCRDYGVVRLTPRENGRVNFRSVDGAAQATAAGRSRVCECRAAQTA